MIRPIVSIRDSAAAAFNPPVSMGSTAVAIRGFGQEVNRNDPQNQMFRTPGDFELWHLADFDEESGKIVPVEPVCIARAKDVRTAE